MTRRKSLNSLLPRPLKLLRLLTIPPWFLLQRA